jgi:RNA polymerase sigma-70 factor (ECF subfamily)
MNPAEAQLAAVPETPLEADQQLVALARAGDREAFEELYRRHRAAVTRRLSYLGGVQAPVADLVQETFLRAYTGLDRFSGRAPFGHWVLRIATNVARTHFRSSGRRPWRLWDDPERQARVPCPGSRADQRCPDQQAVYRALARLSRPLREAVILFELEGATLAEMAAQLELSVNTVASRVRRGRRRLRRALEAMGYKASRGTVVALYTGAEAP